MKLTLYFLVKFYLELHQSLRIYEHFSFKKLENILNKTFLTKLWFKRTLKTLIFSLGLFKFKQNVFTNIIIHF